MCRIQPLDLMGSTDHYHCWSMVIASVILFLPLCQCTLDDNIIGKNKHHMHNTTFDMESVHVIRTLKEQTKWCGAHCPILSK